jgi:His/Glu/Gln/Arg/opine family amino acid ABC transporter permease subunit
MWVDLKGYGIFIVGGIAITLSVWIASLALGAFVGLGVSSAKLWGGRVLRGIAETYTTVIRGIPDLLVIFVVYFGGTVTLTAVAGRYVEVDPFLSGVVALAFVSGAYQAEIYRGAMLGVSKGQTDAGRAIGLAPLQTFVAIVVPQAWRLALPAFGNHAIALLKQTALISVVGLEEIMRRATIASGATSEPFRFYLLAALIYLAISATLTVLFERAERSAARGLARG